MCRATTIPIGSTGTPSSPSSSVAMILPPITSTSTWTTFSHPEDAAVLITFQSYRPSTLDQGLNCCTMNAHYVFFISTIFTENLLPYSVIRTWPQVHGPIRSLTKDFCIIVYLDKIMQNTLMCSFMIHLVTPVAERRILNDKERSYCGIIWDSGLEFAWKGWGNLWQMSRLPVSRVHRARRTGPRGVFVLLLLQPKVEAVKATGL